MSLKTSGNRYARALFDVVVQQGDLAQVDRDLSTAVAVTHEHAPLLEPALRHNVPETARRALMQTLSSRLGLSTPVQKLLVLLAKGGRFELLPVIADAYRERLLAHQSIVRAQVTSASQLTEDNINALQESLGRVTGKRVELSTAVDAELIGGLVARIGSTVYDGSIRTQLSKIRQTLVE